MMNLTASFTKTLAVATGLFVASLSAQATSIIDITVSGGADVVSAPSTDLHDFGDSTVLSWLKSDITAYNGLNGTSFLPAVAGNPLDKVMTPGGPTSLTLNLDNSFDYIFFHWGGPHGGQVQAFYIGGYTGSFDFTPPAGGNSLSFYTLYGPEPETPNTRTVPDGSNTLILFGAAGIGAFAIRRFVGVRSLQ